MPLIRLLAADGEFARDSGPWAREKLSFLDDFVPPALQATKGKLHRYYIDLFAGPGKNIERGTGREFDGSPLRALKMTASGDENTAFTHAVFVNWNQAESEALFNRVVALIASGQCRVPTKNIRFLIGDANEMIRNIMRSIHRDAYALVFADIERLSHWPMSSVLDLMAGHHKSVDFCMLFPMEMAINRMISYERAQTERFADVLSSFFGTTEWREIVHRHRTETQGPQLRRDLERLYLRQLSPRLWAHAETVKNVHFIRHRLLYRLIFASNHDAGKKIAAWAKKHGDTDQQYALL